MAGAGLAWAASGDFWNKKPLAEWTQDEIDKLLTKSPWAREVTAQRTVQRQDGTASPGGTPGQYPGSGGGYPPTIGMPRIGGIGMPRRGPGGGNPRGQRTVSRQGTVRWESAKPILEALKTKLPESMSNRYVISVSGFPAPGSGEDRLDELKQATTIQPKGKEIAQAGVVEKNGSSSDWLFGFSKDAITLTTDDKEVEFMTRIGRFLVKTKFNLKDMLYHGELAV